MRTSKAWLCVAVSSALWLASTVGLVAQDVPGIVVDRVHLPRPSEVRVGDAHVGDAIATIARFDLRRYQLTFLTQRDGAMRPLDRWAADMHLAGGINAGMFLPSGRPCGFVKLRGEVLSARRAGNHEGAIAFDPLGRSSPMGIGGPGCAQTFEALGTQYGSILQARRLLIDCEGRPTTWRTGRYSSAALGVDREGRAVLVHVRTPYRMNVLARMLAAPELGLRGLVYMEGGPEASLVVNAEGQRLALMGSWEDGFHPADDLHEMWDLPNVVGLIGR